MNLLVTGGAGFIGSHFVRAILADRLPGLEGASVTVIDKLAYAGNFANLSPVAESKRLDFVPADVADAALATTVMRGRDAVVHFAAAGPGPYGSGFLPDTPDPAAAVTGTQVLLDAALRHGTGRFLQISTGTVYGSLHNGAWTERAAVSPTTPHAAGKAGADLLALAYHRSHGLPVVVARCSSAYGPRQHPGRPIPRLVTGLLDGRTVPLDGDGSRLREWLHVDDLCRGAALALLDGRAGEIYHIGGSVELSDRDLTGLVLAECGAGWDRVVPSGDTTDPDHRQALDDDKIRQELGWRPRVEFEAGLAATVRWYRENETWWRALLNEQPAP